MTDRPILFSTPMVLALTEGLKTQTRRILKPQPPTEEAFPGSSFGMCRAIADGVKMYSQNDYERLPKHPTNWELIGSVGVARDAGFPKLYNARFAIGDRLWVREAHYLTDNGHAEQAVYAADAEAVAAHFEAIKALSPDFPAEVKSRHLKLRPSIHMPRWASRMTLLVDQVRIERLQDISPEDAKAEGLSWVPPTFGIPGIASSWCGDPRDAYAALWMHLNGEESWFSNPWVIATTFRVVMANIDSTEDQAA